MRILKYLCLYMVLGIVATKVGQEMLTTTDLLLLVIAAACQTWVVEGVFKEK